MSRHYLIALVVLLGLLAVSGQSSSTGVDNSSSADAGNVTLDSSSSGGMVNGTTPTIIEKWLGDLTAYQAATYALMALVIVLILIFLRYMKRCIQNRGQLGTESESNIAVHLSTTAGHAPRKASVTKKHDAAAAAV